MCRMVLVRDKKEEQGHAEDLTVTVLRSWAEKEFQHDGVGLGYIENGGLTIEKSQFSASRVEFTGDASESQVVLGHVRRATRGVIDEINSHPFLSEDGKLMLTHNGTINEVDKIRRHLKKQGHEFESDTDSEVLLHAIEQWGVKKVMNQLKSMGAYGKANWILVDDKGRVTAYSDGHLYYTYNKKSIIIATNRTPFRRNDWKLLRQGTMLKVSIDGKVTTKYMGYFPSYVGTYEAVRTYSENNIDHYRYVDDFDNEEWSDFQSWLEEQQNQTYLTDKKRWSS